MERVECFIECLNKICKKWFIDGFALRIMNILWLVKTVKEAIMIILQISTFYFAKIRVLRLSARGVKIPNFKQIISLAEILS